ncbi:MAG: hypothetical protein SW833_07405 [Cyanobacteriota bacterium]|nr:hypothetical protein [Cyanobacteriota bacterium]
MTDYRENTVKFWDGENLRREERRSQKKSPLVVELGDECLHTYHLYALTESNKYS